MLVAAVFRVERGDPAVDERCDADMAVRLDREAVEHLVTWKRPHHVARVEQPARRRDLARPLDGERPEPPRRRLRDMHFLAVGRQADAVRGHHAVVHSKDFRPVGTCVEEVPRMADIAVILAEVGEPEPALCIEDDVVRTAQRNAVAFGIEVRDRPVRQVDALDLARLVIIGRPVRNRHPVIVEPFEPAIVADIDRAVRTDGRAIRASAKFGDDLDLAVRRHPRQCLPFDLDEDDGAVLHRDRAFGKLQTLADQFHVHRLSPHRISAAGIFRSRRFSSCRAPGLSSGSPASRSAGGSAAPCDSRHRPRSTRRIPFASARDSRTGMRPLCASGSPPCPR